MTRDERHMESHRDCCGWRPEGERCGRAAKSWALKGAREHVCMLPKGHEGKHYDAITCLTFPEGLAVQTDRLGRGTP